MSIKKYILSIFIILFILVIFRPSYALDKTTLDFRYSSGPCNKQLFAAFSSIFNNIYADSCSIQIANDDIESIVTLNLSNKELTSVSTGDNIFKYFINLKELDLSNNNITSINPITNSNIELEKLNISNNNFIDSSKESSITSKLYKIPSLTELDISNNKLKYLTNINQLVNLKRLNAYNNEIIDLKGLSDLTTLEYLNLGENYTKNTIENLNALNTLTSLKYFDFSDNKTSNIIDYVIHMTNLEELVLETNNITNINENIKYLSNLRSLNLYNNQINSVEKLLPLKDNLENLILQKNFLNNVNDFLQMTKLKKLDIAYNNQIGDAYDDNNINSISLKELINSFSNNEKELNYEYITNPQSLEGKSYVSYEDFGARCNGVYDDFIAIRNAHLYANENNVEVKAIAESQCKNKKYHIFKYYEKEVEIKTNVDWNNATYIIHDETINYHSGKYKSIFKISNIDDIVEFSNPMLTINQDTKNISSFIENKLANLNNKGYTEYLFIIKNANLMQYIRTGSNADAGTEQKELILVNRNGEILSDIQNNFDEITSVNIYAIPNKKITIENANFIINSIESHGENTNGKEYYFKRNILFENVGNINVSNIRQSLSKDDISGNYSGFISFHFAAHVNVENLYLHAYKRQYESSYGINLNGVIDANLNDIHTNPSDNSIYDRERFGMMGANYIKDISFNRCVMNRIDTHKSAYNISIKDSTIGYGSIGIIGGGQLNIDNTSVYSNTFLLLRPDYGGTFDGTAVIKNSTLIYDGRNKAALIRGSIYYDENKAIHQYGYNCKLPNLEAIDIKFDLNNNEINNIYLYDIDNLYDYNGLDESYKENSKSYLVTYLPTSVNLHGYLVINGNTNMETFNENTNNYLKDLNNWSFDSFDINQKSQYTVTFNSNGGSSVASRDVNYNEQVTKPSNPTRTGYTFKEWHLNGSVYDFNTPVTSNITLTAVWNKNDVIVDETLKDILEDEGYNVGNNYVSKFTVGDSIATIKNKLGNDVIIETDKEIIATGAVIKKGNESYTVVIKGDLTGDGKINSGDLLQMRKYLLEEVNLVGAYKESGIIESNNEIKSLDLLRLRQYLLGEYVFK